ncbi:hypothetical protein NDU88_005501 [Pleurodeles waltl]|uniref:Uncharacterized protein n=1 Tax=Pleurodeles waltl TaxID=8319 RepID=A0AAV7RMA9_PLEWA|nr:hypothetical protein NDU88_005501 [Pleurodeles waltl]
MINDMVWAQSTTINCVTNVLPFEKMRRRKLGTNMTPARSASSSYEARLSSRETDSSAPLRADPESDWHTTAPEGSNALTIGNPDIRVLIDSPGREGEVAGREEGLIGAGNPDIRVPESVKTAEGLCTRRVREEKDAKGKDSKKKRTEIAGSEGDKGSSGPHLGRATPGSTQETPTAGQESPERLELCHVSGGTWLKQVTVHMRYDHGYLPRT